MNGPLVLERAVDVQRRLLAVGIDTAIGGALALAYHVDDPRSTQDIDLNVSLPADRAIEALQALPDDVPWEASTLQEIRRNDQVRIMWPVPGQVSMPLDLFFAVDRLHEIVRRRCVEVPMLGSTVRVLSATDLTIFKALFDRPKDWPDILSMIEAHDSTVDLGEAMLWVVDIVGEEDPRVGRLRALGGHR